MQKEVNVDDSKVAQRDLDKICSKKKNKITCRQQKLRNTYDEYGV